MDFFARDGKVRKNKRQRIPCLKGLAVVQNGWVADCTVELDFHATQHVDTTWRESL